MSQLLNKVWKPSCSLLLALAAFFFWWQRYPFALAFQEQFQLFLFDGEYLTSRLAEPGGVARYLAELSVQLYNIVWVGALVNAALYVVLQWLMWHLMRPAAACWYGLSFLPPVLLWALMGDENVLLTTGVALALAMVCMLLYPKKPRGRVAFAVIGLPLIYWAIGPMVIIVAVFMALKASRTFAGIVGGVVAIIYSVACVMVSALWLPFPLLRLFLGLSYYRYIETVPYLLVGIVCLVLVLSFVGKWLKAPEKVAPKHVVTAFCLALSVLLVMTFVPSHYDRKKYDLIEYDYLVRAGKWNDILKKSTARQPDLPMSVCATNLALAMNGRLGDEAFQYYQRGVSGLLPPFERNFASLQLTGEAYFQLGLIKTAQRFAFEAMEAIPNYNKSARAVKRLVETNLLNGQYAVARKYLGMLKKTLFYRRWAQRMEKLLYNEQALLQHPFYGKLKSWQLGEDFLFSESEIDKICGNLFVHNPQNTLAMQYLLLCPLLEGDLDRFVGYLQVVQGKTQYNSRYCQEALAYAFMSKGLQPPQGLVSPVVAAQLQNFVQTYQTSGKGSPQLKQFSHTLWHYLMGEE
jgi:hypothetical protein